MRQRRQKVDVRTDNGRNPYKVDRNPQALLGDNLVVVERPESGNVVHHGQCE